MPRKQDYPFNQQRHITANANLSSPPAPIAFIQRPKHFAFGDLHGNALKLIYQLMQTGVMQLSSEDYLQLKMHYCSAENQLNLSAIEAFRSILKKASFNTEASLTFVGDDVADRGHADYLTLLVFEALFNADVDFEVTLSNHGAEFICAYESIDKPEYQPRMDSQLTRSLRHTLDFLRRHPEERMDFDFLVTRIYFPHLKAVSYTIDETSAFLQLFTHAPINLSTLQALAQFFNVDYQEDCIEHLTQSIDGINYALSQMLTSRQFTQAYTQACEPSAQTFNREYDFELTRSTPLYQLTWNRCLPPQTSHALQFHWVHGHLGWSSLESNLYVNLDESYLAKETWDMPGEATFWFSDARSAFQLALKNELLKAPSHLEMPPLAPRTKLEVLKYVSHAFSAINQTQFLNLIARTQAFKKASRDAGALPLLTPHPEERFEAFMSRVELEFQALERFQSLKAQVDAIKIHLQTLPLSSVDKLHDIATKLVPPSTSYKAHLEAFEQYFSSLAEQKQTIDDYLKKALSEAHFIGVERKNALLIQRFLQHVHQLKTDNYASSILYQPSLEAVSQPAIKGGKNAEETIALIEKIIKKNSGWDNIHAYQTFLAIEKDASVSLRQFKSALDDVLSEEWMLEDEDVKPLSTPFFRSLHTLRDKFESLIRDTKKCLDEKKRCLDKTIELSFPSVCTRQQFMIYIAEEEARLRQLSLYFIWCKRYASYLQRNPKSIGFPYLKTLKLRPALKQTAKQTGDEIIQTLSKQGLRYHAFKSLETVNDSLESEYADWLALNQIALLHERILMQLKTLDKCDDSDIAPVLNALIDLKRRPKPSASQSLSYISSCISLETGTTPPTSEEIKESLEMVEKSLSALLSFKNRLNGMNAPLEGPLTRAMHIKKSALLSIFSNANAYSNVDQMINACLQVTEAQNLQSWLSLLNLTYRLEQLTHTIQAIKQEGQIYGIALHPNLIKSIRMANALYEECLNQENTLRLWQLTDDFLPKGSLSIVQRLNQLEATLNEGLETLRTLNQYMSWSIGVHIKMFDMSLDPQVQRLISHWIAEFQLLLRKEAETPSSWTKAFHTGALEDKVANERLMFFKASISEEDKTLAQSSCFSF